MGKKKPVKNPQQAGQSDQAIELVRIIERHKTIRLISLLAAIVLIVGIIGWAGVQIAHKPLWAAIVGTIGSTLAIIIGGQYGLFTYLTKRIRRYTSRNQGRVTELEIRLDPSRSSSHLMKDGTNPPEDGI